MNKNNRVGIIGIEILDDLFDCVQPYIINEKTRYKKTKIYRMINGVNVKISSSRYPVFKKSLSCSKCGIIGKYFAIEKNINSEHYHLNLYALDSNNNEVLMTKDHIIPISKGGRNIQSNFQTMCCNCNFEKGNNI